MTAANRRPNPPPPVAPDDEHDPDDHDEPDLGRLVAQARDIALYAPIAILLDGPAMLPQLAKQGKTHVGNAQWLGKMFLERSGRDLRKRAEQAGAQAYDLLKMFGVIPTDEVPGGPESDTAHRAPVTRIHPREPASSESASGPSSDHLAIPDYDSLSASQVVNRLPSLSPDELAAVYTYESAQRGRKTILNKVAQLQAQ
jgi:hypothetical protein